MSEIEACICHNIPYVNDYDTLCRVRWAEYEATIFFMEKGLNKKEAEQCVKELGMTKNLTLYKREMDNVVESALRSFQRQCKDALSLNNGDSVYNEFISKTKTRPTCRYEGCTLFAKKRYYKGKHKGYAKYCDKTQIDHEKTTIGNVERQQSNRPICAKKKCKRLTKIRYYKGKRVYGNWCDLGKNHSANSSKRAIYQKEYQKSYREKLKQLKIGVSGVF